MSSVGLVVKILIISGLMFLAGSKIAAQQPDNSTLSGIVVDQNGALITGVEITILSSNGTLERTVLTDSEGFFSFPFLPFGEYSLKISKDGFDPSEIPALSIETARQIKIELKVTPLAEAVKVQSETAQIEAGKGDASTFERALLENLPQGGRNQQSLISLVPGVVLTPVDNRNLGQFSSNGQRTNSNFFTVDGVPANFGTTNYDFLGQTGSGSIPAMNVQGGLDNLISTEALSEVRIQTLDFSPATGKTPGATVSFVSRSGGDDFSFSVFENFRSGAFNAKDYFDLEKPPHVFNNYGGYFGGPLFSFGRDQRSKNRTYFFASFEGRRFTLPQPTVRAAVPSRAVRQETRNPVAQAIYNSFPLPNEKLDQPTDAATVPDDPSVNDISANAFFTDTEEFRATYSDPNGAENYNLRIDHVFNPRFSVFGRFNYAPSFAENRNPANLSSFIESDQTTGTFTFGSTQVFAGRFVNEFRFNSSFQTGRTKHDFDGLYGGVLPDRSMFIPAAFEPGKTHFRFALNGFPAPLVFSYGNFAENETRQLSFSDNLSFSAGRHEIRLGFDYRRLSPTLRASGYGISYDFNSVEAISDGTANRVSFYENPNVRTNVLWVSSYIQDNWNVAPRFNLTYGVRWEINPAPTANDESDLLTLANAPDLTQPDQNKLKLAPPGTPYYRTGFRNFAPRVGAAIQIWDRRDQQLILRGGIGTFFDLGQSQFNEIASPFEHTNGFAENLMLPVSNVPFDFFSNAANSNNRLVVVSAAPDYRLPRTYFWTFAAQLRIGGQMFSAAYVGGAGRSLQRTLTLNLAKPGKSSGGYFSDDFSKVIYIDNAYSSDYHAFQFQYSRSLANGLRAFGNYTWSHSIDNNSSDSNISTPFLNYPVSLDRGNSDFDLRHALNIGFTYNLPAIKLDNPLGAFLKNWTFSGIFVARSGLPYDVKIAEYNPLGSDFYLRRADLVEGLPLFLEAPESPTGTRLNPDAFVKPDGQFGQGNLGRNSFTGSTVWQFDAALGKKINLTRKLRIELRTEIYNVFNRPSFSNPETRILYQWSDKIVPKNFGVPTKTMARGFASAEPTGGVSPIFQTGGARALQFNVRISF